MAGMTPWLAVATALAGVNLLMLAALAVVWARNYRTFRSGLLAGLVAFSVVLMVENAVAVYFFFDMGMLYSSTPRAQQTVVVLRALQTLALAFLTYVTLK